MTIQKIKEYITSHVIESDISYRGGTLKIDVSELFNINTNNSDEPIMGAYQNYLGGGIAGAIQTGRQFDIANFNKKDLALYNKVAEQTKRYFYDLNNGGGDEYMQDNVTGKQAKAGYKRLQRLNAKAY